jgi:hypothetical protein
VAVGEAGTYKVESEEHEVERDDIDESEVFDERDKTRSCLIGIVADNCLLHSSHISSSET